MLAALVALALAARVLAVPGISAAPATLSSILSVVGQEVRGMAAAPALAAQAPVAWQTREPGRSQGSWTEAVAQILSEPQLQATAYWQVGLTVRTIAASRRGG